MKSFSKISVTSLASLALAFAFTGCGGGDDAGSSSTGAPDASTGASEPSSGGASLVIKGSDTLGAKMVPQLSEAYQGRRQRSFF